MRDIKVIHQNRVAPLANERLGGLAKEVWNAVSDSGNLQSATFEGKQSIGLVAANARYSTAQYGWRRTAECSVDILAVESP